MMKAVINGRSDEIVDLAKTNLWRARPSSRNASETTR